MRKRHKNIPVFIPHIGCPHTCIFCDQRKISGTGEVQSPLKVKALLEESISTISPEDEAEIAFFGGSFTGIPEPEMIAYLEAAKPYLDENRIKGIRLSTRPDYINSHILDLLKQYGVTAVELGVQSLDREVLELSCRGHTAEDVKKACGLIRQSGLKLGIQIMLGLPGDSYEKTLKTAHEVLKLQPAMLRIYPVLVLRGTELETLYRAGKYEPLSLDEAVSWCADLVPLFQKAGITILRIGLHAAETLEGSIIAGPYHPAFGEMVESRILFRDVSARLDAMSIPESGKIVIKAAPGLMSKLIGQKHSNIKGLKAKYALKEIKVLPDPGIVGFEIRTLE